MWFSSVNSVSCSSISLILRSVISQQFSWFDKSFKIWCGKFCSILFAWDFWLFLFCMVFLASRIQFHRTERNLRTIVDYGRSFIPWSSCFLIWHSHAWWVNLLTTELLYSLCKVVELSLSILKLYISAAQCGGKPCLKPLVARQTIQLFLGLLSPLDTNVCRHSKVQIVPLWIVFWLIDRTSSRNIFQDFHYPQPVEGPVQRCKISWV